MDIEKKVLGSQILFGSVVVISLLFIIISLYLWISSIKYT